MENNKPFVIEITSDKGVSQYILSRDITLATIHYNDKHYNRLLKITGPTKSIRSVRKIYISQVDVDELCAL